jgi:hypothetical protein
MPMLPGLMLSSVVDTVPFVQILFPLHPGYTMTVWAETSEVKQARAHRNEAKRNMVAAAYGLMCYETLPNSALVDCDCDGQPDGL